MFKQLLVIALLVVGVWLFRRLRRRLGARVQGRPAPSYQETVRCRHCGMHVPRAEAVVDERQGYFCSEAHRLARQADFEKGRR